MEFIDIVDEKGVATGESLEKKQAHILSKWHLTAHIWMYNSKGDVLLQKRSSSKKTFPNLWDISVAGHINTGETVEQGACREILEEIGLHVSMSDLEKVLEVKQSYYCENHDYYNNEIQHIFLLKYDGSIGDLHLQREEVERVKFIDIPTLKKELSCNIKKFACSYDYYINILDIIEKKYNLDKSIEVSTTPPLVSIVMAVKDTAPYLRTCIDSIIAQTYKNWELIAVNDHSKDDTLNILREYACKDSRVRVYNSHKPKLIPTLQIAYSKIKGTLINRMDSDDKMPKDKIQILVEQWQKYGKGNVIAGGTEHFVDEGTVGGGFLRYEKWLNNVAKSSTHYQEIYTECVIPSHCWIIHKDDFDRVGAFNPMVYPEDYDLCFRFYKHKLNVVGIDKILHYWRDRENRISRTWEEYKDNRYFDLKLRFFYELDRDKSKKLVLWGAGKNGKDMAKLLLSYESNFNWVCDNENKIGKDIYGIIMQHFEEVLKVEDIQIIIAVASDVDKAIISEILKKYNKKAVSDYWFFL